MDDDFKEPARLEGDTREYYPNRPLAVTACNRGQAEFENDGCFSAGPQFEPDKGYVAVLHSTVNIPDAWEQGFEVRVVDAQPEKTPEDWFTAKPKSKPAPGSTPTAPSKGATARVWAIAEENATGRADRAKVIAACIEAGINKATAGTQWSKFVKSKGW